MLAPALPWRRSPGAGRRVLGTELDCKNYKEGLGPSSHKWEEGARQEEGPEAACPPGCKQMEQRLAHPHAPGAAQAGHSGSRRPDRLTARPALLWGSPWPQNRNCFQHNDPGLCETSLGVGNSGVEPEPQAWACCSGGTRWPGSWASRASTSCPLLLRGTPSPSAPRPCDHPPPSSVRAPCPANPSSWQQVPPSKEPRASWPTPTPRTNGAGSCRRGSVTRSGSRVSEKCLPVAQHPASSHLPPQPWPAPAGTLAAEGGREVGAAREALGTEALPGVIPGLWILCLGRGVGSGSELQALD